MLRILSFAVVLGIAGLVDVTPAHAGGCTYYCPDGSKCSGACDGGGCCAGRGGSGSSGGSGASDAAGAAAGAIVEGFFDMLKETPQQEAARREREARQAEEARLTQERLERQRREEARKKKEKQDALDAEASTSLDLLEKPSQGKSDDQLMSADPEIQKPSPPASGHVPQIACVKGKSGHVCHTYTCGGATNKDVCCPVDYPILNYCDCECYKRDTKFECSQSMACQYSTELEEPKKK